MTESGFPEASRPGEQPKITKLSDFTAEALGQLVQWLNTQVEIPILQVLGFQQFTFQPAPTIDTSQSTTSTTFVDLTTVGPLLTGLPDGKYAIFFGCQVGLSAADSAIMSLSINGAAATDTDSIVVTGINGDFSSTSRLLLKTLQNAGNNSLTAKYRSNLGTSCSFLRRWLIVMKYSNA